jgi:hypothetical protein
MKVTVEEMNRVAMDVGLRDYCAHTAIAVMECRHKYAPFASHPCYAKYHKWMDCQMKVCICTLIVFFNQENQN